MVSIGFPNMFASTNIKATSSNLVYDKEATKQNLESLLYSEKGEFKFDPFFGIRLKRYLFEQNNYILYDILVDELYTQISTFMPQILIERKNITLTVERGKIYCKIVCQNRVDFTTDTYNLVLFQQEEEFNS